MNTVSPGIDNEQPKSFRFFTNRGLCVNTSSPVDLEASPPVSGPRHRHLNSGRMQRRNSITPYSNSNVDEVEIDHDESLNFNFDEDVFNQISPKKPRSCILIMKPSPARVLDMELPSPPIKYKKSFKSSGGPSSLQRVQSISTGEIQHTFGGSSRRPAMPLRKHHSMVVEVPSASASLPTARVSRPSSPLGYSTVKAAPVLWKPQSERGLPLGLPLLPFGDHDEAQDHSHKPRSLRRRNSITRYNLQKPSKWLEGSDDDINDVKDYVDDILQSQQTQSLRHDRSAIVAKQDMRICKSQREDRKIHTAKSDRKLLRRNKIKPSTPTRRRQGGGEEIIEDTAILNATPPKPSSSRSLLVNQDNHRSLSRRILMGRLKKAPTTTESIPRDSAGDLRRRPALSSPQSKSQKDPLGERNHKHTSESLSARELKMDEFTSKDHRRRSMLATVKNSFRKNRLPLERSASTRSISSRAA